MDLNYSAEDFKKDRLLDVGHWYPLEVTEYEDLGLSKSKKSNGIRVELTVTDGDFEGVPVPVFFNDSKDMRRNPVIKFAMAIGGKRDKDGNLKVSLGEGIVGKTCWGYAVQREYNNKPQNEFTDFADHNPTED